MLPAYLRIYAIWSQMIAEPVKKDFIVPQGATYPIVMRWLDSNNAAIPLGGALIRAQLRKEFDSPTVALDCTLANGKATLDTENWYFGFVLSAADTAALEATTYVYDLIVTKSDGDVTRALQGIITLTPGVTHG